MNPNKYYHNDYKKMIGLDETRTASEKILDKVIGNITPKLQQFKQQKLVKKVKEQSINISHLQVLQKILKNIENNISAVKIVKPLNILKKCLGDFSFISNQGVNLIENWSRIIYICIDIQSRIVGNVCEKNQIIQSLVDIFSNMEGILQKLKQKDSINGIKEEAQQNQIKIQQALPQQNILSIPSQNPQLIAQTKQKTLIQLIQIHKLYHLYYKLYTDDSFIFNKLLLQFKSIYFQSYKNLQKQSNNSNESTSTIKTYINKLLLNIFNLPHEKYKWIKQSLLQFYKEFNIEYKHLLDEEFKEKYLKQYNVFVNWKNNYKGYSENNSLNGQSKGGKIEIVQVVSNDGLDKWTSKQ